MARYSRFTLVFIFIFLSVQAFCCTSVIISGNARADGRPVMYKHRDTGELNNRLILLPRKEKPGQELILLVSV